MSADMNRVAYEMVKKRMLKVNYSCVLLNCNEGKRLIPNAEGIIVEGNHKANSYSYLFVIDRMTFYFKSQSKIEIAHQEVVNVKQIDVPF